MTDDIEILPTEIIRRLQQSANGSIHIQGAANVALLAHMQAKLDASPDWRTEEFIKSVTAFLGAIIRDFEPLAKPVPVPVTVPQPTLTTPEPLAV